MKPRNIYCCFWRCQQGQPRSESGLLYKLSIFVKLFEDILEFFFEDGITTIQRGSQSDHTDSMKRLPQWDETVAAAGATKTTRRTSTTSKPCSWRCHDRVQQYFAAGCVSGMGHEFRP